MRRRARTLLTVEGENCVQFVLKGETNLQIFPAGNEGVCQKEKLNNERHFAEHT